MTEFKTVGYIDPETQENSRKKIQKAREQLAAEGFKRNIGGEMLYQKGRTFARIHRINDANVMQKRRYHTDKIHVVYWEL